ncbi:hypothetical protein [Photorhabdus luminescens]|nr:hypothetical protein [Photorhabdus luminescens]MCW7764435.1 hypothetical protein [Photorhabdus luminescens subsp. venezuelensis]
MRWLLIQKRPRYAQPGIVANRNKVGVLKSCGGENEKTPRDGED